ncbi:RNI-like protein [Phlegmacium glaucopus]|nr:RNI-like protein [Phlegmacium glaucopus]
MSFHASFLSEGTSSTEFVISTNGAVLDPKEVIKELRARPNLKSLDLNHSVLEGEESKVLFRWLAYGDKEENNDEEKCPSLPLPQLTNISLDGVRLGNMGFSALVGWLECLKQRQQMNMSISPSKPPDGIRGLSLQRNYIEGTSDLALLFVSALAFHKIEPPYIFSSLSYLNLSSNPLSLEFKQALFPSLASLPSLRVLSLTMTGLNQTDTSALAAYIGRCRLTDFNASANNIGYSGLKKILKAMRRCWTLEKVYMYGNDVGDEGGIEHESSDEYEGWSSGNPDLSATGISGSRWRLLERKLQRILSRNLYLKRTVRDQAFELLRCSRLLLLNQHSDHGQSHSELDLLGELVEKEVPHHPRCIDNCECLPTFHHSHSKTSSSVPMDPHHASNSHFPFARLPIEIQLIILSQLAPILSSSQQIRIFEHAVDKTTLPDLSLRLPSNGDGARYSVHAGGPFAPTATERERWLEVVGCDAYDPNC